MEQTFASYKKSFSVKTYWKEILAVFILLLAVYFFKSQEGEIKSIIPRIESADLTWTGLGVLVTVAYIVLQSCMYQLCFRSIGIELSLMDSLEIFLKRNLLSVFLPAGGLSSMAYTPLRLKKKRVNSAKGTQASILNAYIGTLTVFLVGVPIILYSLAHRQDFNNAWIGLVLLGLLLLAIVFIVRSFTQRGLVYKLINKLSPAVCIELEGLFSEKINQRQLILAVCSSILIEVIGILMVYVSMKALGIPVSIEVAAVGYILSVLPMLVSPFLHGLGAVEFTLAFFLTRYGYTSSVALSATLIYRAFEFWLPLLLGLVAFLWNGKDLLGRVLPAAGIFFLGVANVVSVIKVPMAERLQWELAYLPMESMHASKMMILFVGIFLMLASANLLKGHRMAFILALILTVVSIAGQLVSTFHDGEAMLAFIMLILLLVYRKEYRIKSDKKWLTIGFRTFFIAFIAVCLFDCIGFYLLERKHFGIDFTWVQSMEYTFKSFFLLSYDDLVPTSHFAKEFLSIVHSLAFGVWIFLLFTLFKTRKVRGRNEEHLYAEAARIVEENGTSALDFYKMSQDKLFYILPEEHALIAYKLAMDIAVVLEGPVCAADKKIQVIHAFEHYCLNNGLKTCYYRVGEEALSYFKPFNKRKALLGQEAILEISQFSLSGADRKSLRNGQNNLQKKGYVTTLCSPPHNPGLLTELKAVSDEWLKAFHKQEVVFSSGMFDLEELKKEDVILVRDVEGKLVAFLNIVPDYAPGECTYDMLRKTADAANGCEDALLIRLIDYAKENGYQYLNLGMASFTGITDPENTPEQLEKYASEKIKPLAHFHGLRNFKEKYATTWLNKYLVYDNGYDLLKIPMALAKVMNPSKNRK
ncbi:MAG: phosphatidylglycerol lysyltransferase domain-containing protein [Bacteroidota bacterium]|nr:phosphatidylglycerol lysyltransferase domain-containing protein [Bacteroidota bacterium]